MPNKPKDLLAAMAQGGSNQTRDGAGKPKNLLEAMAVLEAKRSTPEARQALRRVFTESPYDAYNRGGRARQGVQPEQAPRTPSDLSLGFEPKIGVPQTTPSAIMPPAPEYTEPTLRQAEPKGFVGRALDVVKTPFVKTPEEQQASDWRIYATSKVRGVPMQEAAGQIEQEKKDDFNRKAEIAFMFAGGGALATSKVTLPAFARGIATFMAVEETKQAIIREASGGTKEDFADFLNDNTSEGTKQAVKLFELLAEGGLAGTIEKKALGPLISKIKSKINPEKGLAILKKLVSTDVKNDLAILGLEEGASKTQVKSKHRELANTFHPDKNVGASESQLKNLTAEMGRINAAFTRLQKNYKPEVARPKDITPKTTPTNQAHIDALKEIGLEWGASRRNINTRYSQLREQGKVTPEIQKAFDTLMKGEKKYNPYGESDAYIEAQKKAAIKKTAEQIRADALIKKDAVQVPQRYASIPLASEYARTAVGRQLPVGTETEVPPADTPQAGFQILDPKKANMAKRLVQDLDTAKAKKQKVLDAGNLRGTTAVKLKADIAKINDTIAIIEEKITTARAGMIKATGPIVSPQIPQITPETAPGAPTLPTIRETVAKVKEKATQAKIADAITKKKPLKTYKAEKPRPAKPKAIKKVVREATKDVIKRKPKSYKQIAEEARKYKEAKRKPSPAIARVLGKTDRAKLAKRVLEKKPKKAISIAEVRSTTIADKELTTKLGKMKRDGMTEGEFRDLSVNMMSDSMATGKKDRSGIIDKFIDDNFETPDGRLYKRRTTSIHEAEPREAKASKDEFKLFNEAHKMLKKYGELTAEKYVPRGAHGVHYDKSGNIVVKSLNDIPTVVHELAHRLDAAKGIIEKIQREGSVAMLQALEDAYFKYYDGAKKNAKDITKLKEGFASLVENFAMNPTATRNDFPLLVRSLLTPDGKFYTNQIGELLKDVNKLMAEYNALSSLQKIGSVVVSGEREIKKEKLLSTPAKVKEVISDYVYPLEYIEKLEGIANTEDAPSIYYRHRKNVLNVALNNTQIGKGFYMIKPNGDQYKVFDYNFGDVALDLAKEGQSKDFGYYLTARRKYFENKELESLKAKEPLTDEETARLKTLEDIEKAEKNFLNKDDVNDAYLANKDRFADAEQKYDSMLKEFLKFSIENEFIDKEVGAGLMQRQGYAPLMRSILDEITGGEFATRAPSKLSVNVKQFIGRTGSQKAILDPFVTGIQMSMYLFDKAMLKKTFEKISKMKGKGAIQDIQTTAIPAGGRMIYPSADANTIQFRTGGKIKTIKLHKDIAKVFETDASMREYDMVSNLMKTAARTFVRGTTGILYPAFMFTNMIIDSQSALAQTRQNIIPFFDGVYRIAKALTHNVIGGIGKNEAKKWNDYKRMGGLGQAKVAMHDKTPEEFIQGLTGRRIAGGITAKAVSSILDSRVAMSIPGINKVSTGMVIRAIKSLLHPIEIISKPHQLAEAVNRYAEYSKAMDSGAIQAQGMRDAGSVTADFGQRGSLTGSSKLRTKVAKMLHSWLPYANSAIQVPSATIKAYLDPKTRHRAIGATLGYSALKVAGLMATIATYRKVMEEGTEEEKEEVQDVLNQYKNLNNYTVGNNFISMNMYDNSKLNRVRAPSNLSMPGTIVNMAIAEMLLDKDISAKDYLDSVKDPYISSQFDVFMTSPQDGAELMMNWLNPLVKAPVESVAKFKSFPHIEGIEPAYMIYKNSEERFFPWTNDLAIMLGQTEIMKKDDISPIQIEHFLKTSGGRGLDDLTKYLDEGLMQGAGKALGESFKRLTNNESFLFSGIGYKQFYKDKQRMNNDYSNFRKTDPDKASDIKSTNTVYNKVSTLMSDFRKINGESEKGIPLKHSNDVYEIIELLNKKKYREAEIKYDEYAYDLSDFSNSEKSRLDI